MPSQEDLKTLFAHHAPTSAQIAQYHEIDTPALILAQTMVKHCTASAATDMAIHMLFTAVAIAKGQINNYPNDTPQKPGPVFGDPEQDLSLGTPVPAAVEVTPATSASAAEGIPVQALDPVTEEPVAAVAIPITPEAPAEAPAAETPAEVAHPAAGYPVDLPGDLGE